MLQKTQVITAQWKMETTLIEKSLKYYVAWPMRSIHFASIFVNFEKLWEKVES